MGPQEIPDQAGGFANCFYFPHERSLLSFLVWHLNVGLERSRAKIFAKKACVVNKFSVLFAGVSISPPLINP
jgi:hypothetical protein